MVSSLYLWFSIDKQNLDQPNTQPIVMHKLSKMWIIAPLLLLFFSPIAYLYLGNYEKQVQLVSANQLLSDMISPQAAIRSRVLDDAHKLDLEELFLALRAACAQQPGNGELWFTLAEAYFRLKIVGLADAAITRAIKLEPRPSWLVANAQILSLRSIDTDIDKSIRLLQQALTIQPDHQSALLTLGFIYLQQKEYQLAISAWLQLKSISAKLGNNTDLLSKQIELAQKQLNSSR